MREADSLRQVYDQLVAIMKPYEPHLRVIADQPGNYALNAGVDPARKKDLYFGGVAVKKNYVSYYLMPVYVFPELLDGMLEELRAHMQGKSCFNFRKSDPRLFRQLSRMTKAGFNRYKKAGYLHK